MATPEERIAHLEKNVDALNRIIGMMFESANRSTKARIAALERSQARLDSPEVLSNRNAGETAFKCIMDRRLEL